VQSELSWQVHENAVEPQGEQIALPRAQRHLSW